MKVVRYREGKVGVEELPRPSLPGGGIVVQTEACGLCSGELMDWYMRTKGAPVLGHEVTGRVVESDDSRFPVGQRVFPHHHAPCGACPACRRGAFVQCDTWRATRLEPGGMAEFFAVAKANLADTHLVDDLRAIDAALVEPVACVVKSLRQASWRPGQKPAVVGLGNMGLLHMRALGADAVGYDLSATRRAHAVVLGMAVAERPVRSAYDVVFVCPGSFQALELAVEMVAPRGFVLLFAPFGESPPPPGLLDRVYFKDVTLAGSYSAGPDDTAKALELLRARTMRAEDVVSDFVTIDELPGRYPLMRSGEILKAMVVF